MTFSGPSKSPNNTAPTYPATAAFSAGVATASVTLVDVQTTTITANDTTDTYNGTASNNITVNAGGASSFTVSAPTTATAGTPFPDTITALDPYGNTATGYTGSQTITFTGPANAPGGTAPTYPASVTFTNGVATPSITLYDAQTTTLTAKQGTISGTSGNITVSAGANHQIGASAASPQTAGTAFNVTLTAQDSWGNPTGTLTGTKNLTFSGPSNSPNNTAPTYPATATFTAGVATASVTLVDVQTTTITANDTTDSYNGIRQQQHHRQLRQHRHQLHRLHTRHQPDRRHRFHRDDHRTRRLRQHRHELHRQPDDHLHRPRQRPQRYRPDLPRLGHLHQRSRHPPVDHPV